MLKLYTSYSCSSCKKVDAWLDEYGIAHEVINIFADGVTGEDIMYMLQLSEEGFHDIISIRSKIYARRSEEIEGMTVKQLIAFIIENPTVLKRPIIVDDVTDQMVVGYSKEELKKIL